MQIWGMVSTMLSVYRLERGTPKLIWVIKGSGLHATGFESPAQDYMQKRIDLNEVLIKNPDHTFFADVTGPCMVDAGIPDPCRVVVDKSLTAKNGDVIVAVVNGEFCIRLYHKKGGVVSLVPKNARRPDIKTIVVTEDMEFSIWGVVKYVISDPKEVLRNDRLG